MNHVIAFRSHSAEAAELRPDDSDIVSTTRIGNVVVGECVDRNIIISAGSDEFPAACLFVPKIDVGETARFLAFLAKDPTMLAPLAQHLIAIHRSREATR
jgi:hypothetical protein